MWLPNGKFPLKPSPKFYYKNTHAFSLSLSLCLPIFKWKSRIQFQQNLFAFHWKYVRNENKNCVEIVSIVLNKTSQCCWIRSVFFFHFLFVSTWLDLTFAWKESKWNECKSVRWTDFFSFQIKIKKLQIGDEVFCRNKVSVCAWCISLGVCSLPVCLVKRHFKHCDRGLNGEKKMFIQLFNVDYAYNVAFFVCLRAVFSHAQFSKAACFTHLFAQPLGGFFHYFFSSSQTQQTVYASSLDLWYCASQVHAPLICTKECACVLLCTIHFKWQAV